MRSLFLPLHDRPNRSIEQLCAECGRIFRPHQLSEGAELLCDTCYEAQFNPSGLRHWQKTEGRLHRAR